MSIQFHMQQRLISPKTLYSPCQNTQLIDNIDVLNKKYLTRLFPNGMKQA